MVERDPIRANFPNSPACGQWETLLADALDGLLRPEDEDTFSSHMATCIPCAAMFEEARRGREWLEFLAPEPEVPAYLLDRILIETGHGHLDLSKFDPAKLVVAGGPAVGNVIPMAPVWQRPGFTGRMRRFAEPRLMMTAAMAFFSIALTLSLTGVRFSPLKLSDLRPATVRSVVERRIMTASTPIIRYYDHLRFVYEVESRVKELQRSNEEDQQPKSKPSTNNGTGGEGETHKKDGGSELNPKLNPNETPQQTVNPRTSLWRGEALEAEDELAPRLNDSSANFSAKKMDVLETSNKFNAVHTSITSKGIPSLNEASGSDQGTSDVANQLKSTVMAVPERSSKCLA